MKQDRVTTHPVPAGRGAGIPSLNPRELGGRLAGLSLRRQVIALALWPFLEQMLNFMVGFVDMALAGHLSVEATEAMSVAVYFQWFIGLMQSAVGIGATAIIARATGARHRSLANGVVGQAMVMAVVMGLCTGVLLFATAPALTRLMGLHAEAAPAPVQIDAAPLAPGDQARPAVEEDSARLCIDYLRIVALAAPFSAILFVGGACLRGAGDTRTPFFVLVLVNLINAGLNLTLVRAPAPWGGFGMRGIATGTAIAWVCGSLIILTVLLGGWGGAKLHLHRLKPHWHTMKRVIRVGGPGLFESFFGMWLPNMMVLSIVGHMNDKAALAAHGVAIRVEAISYMPGFALGIAAATLAGQYLGLGDPQRARQAIKECWKFGAGLMFLWGVVFLTVPEILVRVVTDKTDILALTPRLLHICGFVQVFFGTAIVLGQGMRGAGDTAAVSLLTFTSTYMVRLPMAILFGWWLDWGIQWVWIGLCTELTFRGCVFAWRFRSGQWMKAKV